MNRKANNNKWKDLFLSSGIPLEYLIRDTLKEFDFDVPSEYHYFRRNEYGQELLFSIDIHATKLIEPQNLYLEFFIECKYRHDSVKWIFTPEHYELLGPKFRDLFITLDQLNRKLKIEGNQINKFSSNYALCGKGIEVQTKSTNPEGIRKGISQLKHGLAHEIIDCLRHQLYKWLGNEENCFVLIPILLTSAEIWRLKDKSSLNDIKKANNINDVCEKLDIILYHEEPTPDLKKYTFELFTKSFTQEEKSLLDKKLKDISSNKGYKWLETHFSNYYPSIFLIINHERFEMAISNCIKFFSSKDIIKQ
jgi:hypothetical protein